MLAWIFPALLCRAAEPTSWLDARGQRGPVPFRHEGHEQVANHFPHPVREEVSCTGCHHKVEEIIAARQYQACSKCHGPDGFADNPEDKDGIELSGREVSHRACIGCHRASKSTAPDLFQKASFTRCSECHQRNRSVPVIQEDNPPRPAQFEPSSETTLLLTEPGRSLPDRWLIEFPSDPRRQQSRGWFDPYHQNRWKGDYPLAGTRTFLTLGAESESVVNQRQLTGALDAGNRGTNLFDRGNQLAVRESLLFTIDLKSGTAFLPAAWRVNVSPAVSVNHLSASRNGIVNADPAAGRQRTKAQAVLQSAFGEIRLGDTPNVLPFLGSEKGVRGDSPAFDSTSLRAGIQPFASDFRGFLFNDTNLGIRLFGNAASNRYQFNLAGFRMLEKNVNSEFNTFRSRGQAVFAANLYRQDTWRPGYTMSFSLHHNHDRGLPYLDENGFAGRVRRAQLDAVYLGWAGEGHLGRLNLTHAFYQALGRDGANAIAGRAVSINAQMAAAEASLTADWLRFRAGFLFASGDATPRDGAARGFDSILDAPDFAGGRFSFWNQQGLRLVRTSHDLVSQNSLFPSLRGNKFTGQANFVNPGLFLWNTGLEADVTPKIRLVANWNSLRFHHTEPLQALTGSGSIKAGIGLDNGFGARLRPWLNENVSIDTGYSFLLTGEGTRQIYGGETHSGSTLHSAFVRLRLVY